MSKLYLTARALSDLDQIESHSIRVCGRRVAEQCLADLDAALQRLATELSLLKNRHDYAGRLRFYRVREHVLIGDVIGDSGYFLTVWHGAMDFVSRLNQLEPGLVQEAELMAQQITQVGE